MKTNNFLHANKCIKKGKNTSDFSYMMVALLFKILYPLWEKMEKCAVISIVKESSIFKGRDQIMQTLFLGATWYFDGKWVLLN